MTNNYTHERIPRRAKCLQWTGKNNDAVFALLAQHGMIGELFRQGNFIHVFSQQSYYTTLGRDHWLIEGEDGQLRNYIGEKFKLMYRPIDDELERLRAFVSDVYDIEMSQNVVESIMKLSRKHGSFPVSKKAPE